MEDFTSMVIMFYLIAHLPAFIMLVIGLALLKEKPSRAKTLLILAGVYFVIGGGICGKLLGY